MCTLASKVKNVQMKKIFSSNCKIENVLLPPKSDTAVDNLVELHVNIISDRTCYALPIKGNKNPDTIFHNPLNMPRKNRKRKRKPGDLASSIENRHKRRCNRVKHERTVRNLFQNLPSLTGNGKPKARKNPERKLK